MNWTPVITCCRTTLFFSFLNLPSLIFTYLTHSIHIVLNGLEKLEGATRLIGVITERNERLKVDEALVLVPAWVRRFQHHTVYITRGDGVTSLVAP